MFRTDAMDVAPRWHEFRPPRTIVDGHSIASALSRDIIQSKVLAVNRGMELVEQTGEETDAPPGFGVRLRFRMTKGFTTNEPMLSADVGGHLVTLASPDEKPLQEGGWYCLRATGFDTPDDAVAFGTRLNIALQVTSLRRMLGVDVGSGRATSSLGKVVYDALAEQGAFVRPNIHGLDVFEDRPGTAWFNASLQGSVSTNPTAIFDDISALVGAVGVGEPKKFDAVRLLNEALVSSDAPSQLTLAIAAVEMLAQGGKWSEAQNDAIERLAVTAQKDRSLSETEQQELAAAVRRVYPMSVMEGFRRLLAQLGLMEIWPHWRDLYSDRSRILHGLAYAKPEERVGMIAPATLLSSRIVLSALEAEIPGAASELDEILHLPKVYKKFDSPPPCPPAP